MTYSWAASWESLVQKVEVYEPRSQLTKSADGLSQCMMVEAFESKKSAVLHDKEMMGRVPQTAVDIEGFEVFYMRNICLRLCVIDT